MVYNYNMGRADIIRAEESLRDFLINEYRIENQRAKMLGKFNDIVDTNKYRRLTIAFNDDSETLYILVQIASYNAIFDVEEGKKVEGGMPVEDTRLIESWISMKNNKEILRSLSKKRNYNEKFIELRPFDND